MNKNFRTVIFVAAAVMAVVLVFFAVNSIVGADYEKASKKTSALKSYETAITTIVTVSDGEHVKTSFIDQMVSVYNKGKKDMRYKVETKATSTDVSSGKVAEENNSYVYYDGSYYYDYPGVKYKSAATPETAKSNIENLVNVITFPLDKMYDITEEKENGETVYSYVVDYADVSAYVAATLQSATSLLEGVSLSIADVSAEATVKKGYVTERGLYVVYEGAEGEYISLEMNTKLNNTDAEVPVPDKTKYADYTK